MNNKFREKIYKYFPYKSDIRLSLFNVIDCIGILGGWIAFISTVFLAGTPWIQTATILTTEFVLNASFVVANKCKKLNLGAVMIVVIITFVIFPVMFFTGGGLEGGMISWFIMGMVFNFLLIEGKVTYIIMIFQILINTACCIVAYLKPELVTPFNNSYGSCLDIVQSMIVVGVGIGLILRIQLDIYKRALKENKEQNIELENAIKLADSANKAKRDFLANMSHEMRTPINAIMGMNEMILREEDNPEILSYAEDVKYASETLLSLVNDVLDISKVETGKTEIVECEYEIYSLVRDCYTLIAPRLHSKDLIFEVENDETLPSIVKGDDVHIKQAVMNLLTNAVKYTECGKIVLGICRGDVQNLPKDEVELKITVKDSGIGIKEEDLSSVFDSFQRVDIEKNRNIEGTGLGLSLTKKLIELMGGTISVSSQYGKGTTFTVTIRQKIVSDIPVGNMSNGYAESREVKKSPASSFMAPNAKILVVDDVPMNLMVIERLLKNTKIQVDKANSGMQCIEMAAKKHYDIIFMDHMMPQMDGVETKRRLDDNEEFINFNKDTPVIMLTANAINGMREKFMEQGFTDYLSKPVEPEKLDQIIYQYLPKDLIVPQA